MATVLWCYLRNNAFKKDKDYHLSADLTGQANHLGCTIQADIIKQKLPENNGGYKALNTGGSSYGKLDERIYTELTSDTRSTCAAIRWRIVISVCGPDQFWRGERRAGLCRRCVHGGCQQACRRHGPDFRS